MSDDGSSPLANSSLEGLNDLFGGIIINDSTANQIGQGVTSANDDSTSQEVSQTNDDSTSQVSQANDNSTSQVSQANDNSISQEVSQANDDSISQANASDSSAVSGNVDIRAAMDPRMNEQDTALSSEDKQADVPVPSVMNQEG
jgi:hypothetical protein